MSDPALGTPYDAVVLGGGIVGATIAAHLAPHLRLAMVEREDEFCRHTTGRSAAMFVPSYGGPAVRSLTAASADFFFHPPAAIASVLRPRAVLHVARAGRERNLEAIRGRAWIRDIGPGEALRLVPILQPAAFAGGCVLEDGAGDIDVDALHAYYIALARSVGATIFTGFGDADIAADGCGWRLGGPAGEVRAKVLVNAAGAWADEVATVAGVKPLGIRPLLRTVVLVDSPKARDFAGWPTVMDAEERIYFRPFAGRLLATACDETPSPPCDAAPSTLAVATAMARLCETAEVSQTAPIRHRWAGLRTFTPSRVPRIGWADDHPRFFWAAGLGGFGIQTSPAVGRLAAELILSRLGSIRPLPPPDHRMGETYDRLEFSPRPGVRPATA